MKKSQTVLTEKEQAAIEELKRAIRHLPPSLGLAFYTWTSTVVIFKRVDYEQSRDGLHQVGKITKRSLVL